jgi:hypothetical protein
MEIDCKAAPSLAKDFLKELCQTIAYGRCNLAVELAALAKLHPSVSVPVLTAHEKSELRLLV